jgi:hypothetical protein
MGLPYYLMECGYRGHRTTVRVRRLGVANSPPRLCWRLVDAISAYVRGLGRPPVIANAAVTKGIERADAKDEGLAGRVRSVAAVTAQADSAESVLVDLAIGWRNCLVHQSTAGKLSKQLASEVRAHAVQFSDLYQGLRVEDLINHAGHRPAVAPTLKEITAIVRAAHKLVEKADGFLLRDMDLEPYLKEILRQYLTEDEGKNPKSPIIRAGKVWNRSPDRRESAIVQIAFNNGFTAYRDGAPNKLAATAIDRLVDMSPSDAVAELVT